MLSKRFPNSRYYFKFILIIALIMILLIPQGAIMSLISERDTWRHQAYQSIRQSWPGKQIVAGPVLVIPYQLSQDVKESIRQTDNGLQEVVTTARIKKDTLHLVPEQLQINSTLSSEMRYRGIYQVPVYRTEITFKGHFNPAALQKLQQDNQDQTLSLFPPKLSVLVNDQRGIASTPSIEWLNQKIAFKPGSALPGATAGIHTVLPDLKPEQASGASILPFQFTMELRGMQAMQFALLAEKADIQLVSDWAHPKFSGALLPEQRDINEQGFTAHWRTSSFSYNIAAVLDACSKGQCQGLAKNAVGFELHQPVDIYQQSERSIKYALLFILLTFMVLILFELLKKLRIHPVQYTLVGLALTIFYLLLVSLSEHIAFSMAYLLAASASSSLLTLYFGSILKSRRLGTWLGGGLLALYSILYIILQSEDNALLMGSLLLFAVLATLMLSTRHLDWYNLTQQSPATSKPSGKPLSTPPSAQKPDAYKKSAGVAKPTSDIQNTQDKRPQTESDQRIQTPPSVEKSDSPTISSNTSDTAGKKDD